MNNQTFFLVSIVLILILCLPNMKTKKIMQIQQISQIPQISQISQIPQIPQISQIQQELSKIIDQTSQLILPTTQTKKQTESKNIINEYLNQNECNENFDTMGVNMDMGNNMNFKQNPNPNPNPTSLSKALSKSLVPDFQPNYLNINPDLNSYGYSTTNPEADKYYIERGFMNPEDGSKFADSVSYMLSHPYQTRYCENKN